MAEVDACVREAQRKATDAATHSAHEQLGLVTLALPLDLPDVPLCLLWHQRYDNDPAHTWLRETATRTLHSLFTQLPPLTSNTPAELAP